MLVRPATTRGQGRRSYQRHIYVLRGMIIVVYVLKMFGENGGGRRKRQLEILRWGCSSHARETKHFFSKTSRLVSLNCILLIRK